MNAKVNEFLYEIVDKTLYLAYHELSRYAALPYDVARALRLFAENGFANASVQSSPKFVIDCSSDDDPDDADWEDRVDSDDEDEQEDISVTISMIQVDDYEYVSFESDDEAFIGENKYQQDNLISIFYDKYPPVIIEELTDEQFRTEVLVPLFSADGHVTWNMGFEDLDPDEDMFPLERDATVMIGMLKRAMYAFVVASIREDFEQEAIQKLLNQVALYDRELEKRRAKEEEMIRCLPN